MPRTPHIERHFTASDSVRDVVIGMSDGLTVPFALAAGLSVPWTAPGSSWSRASPRSRREGSRWAWADTWRPGATPSTTPSSARARLRDGHQARRRGGRGAHILRSFGLAAEESAPIVAALRKRPRRGSTS